MPAATASWIASSCSSKRSPCSLWASKALIRIHVGKSGPTAARMARTTSTRRRARPARSPPQPSVRVLAGLRNSSMK